MVTDPDSLAVPTESRMERRFSTLLVLVSALVLLLAILVTIGHLRDTYTVDHVSGVWIALARYLNGGVLYPGVFENGFYGGSRYAPMYFALHAAVARLTGEYILSGKLVSLAVSVACSWLVCWTLRRRGSTWPLTWALTTLALVSSSAFLGVTTIRGDVLPVAWMLAALLIAHRERNSTNAVLAALCCTAALLSKITAGWAPIAILAMSVRTDRRFAAIFLVTWLATWIGGIAALDQLSDGRLLTSFRVFSDGGFIALLAKSPVRLIRYVAFTCPVLMVLMPFTLLECALAARERQFNGYHWSFVLSIPVLLVIFADRGTASNHLVDLAVLNAILTGMLAARSDGLTWRKAAVTPILTAALFWALLTAEARTIAWPLRDLLSPKVTLLKPNKPLAALISDSASMLTEDAFLDVSRGRVPVVLDPYALVFIEKKHPEWVARLVERIQRREFAFVVLQFRLDQDSSVNKDWYSIVFGRKVSGAIRANYKFLVAKDGYCVFVPA